MKAAVNLIFQGQNKLLYRNLIKTNIFQTLWLLQHYIRDHSYITSALEGGEGGSENANFCLFLVLKTCGRRGEGGPKIPKM